MLETISTLVMNLPAGAVEALATALDTTTEEGWPVRRQRAVQAFASPHYRFHVEQFLIVWQQHTPQTTNAAMALALMAAAHTHTRARQAQTVELVWTGPVGEIPVRRTAQVLHGLIESAQHTLLVISFAVYDVPEIAAALVRAAHRGVVITLVIESPTASAGKVTYDGFAALGSAVAAVVRVYRWPLNQRPLDEAGKHGSLHAKCAIADRQQLLISSANLTRYALDLNMELGLLVRGGPQPGQVVDHVQQLIGSGILVAMPRT